MVLEKLNLTQIIEEETKVLIINYLVNEILNPYVVESTRDVLLNGYGRPIKWGNEWNIFLLIRNHTSGAIWKNDRLLGNDWFFVLTVWASSKKKWAHPSFKHSDTICYENKANHSKLIWEDKSVRISNLLDRSSQLNPFHQKPGTELDLPSLLLTIDTTWDWRFKIQRLVQRYKSGASQFWDFECHTNKIDARSMLETEFFWVH